MQAKKFHYYSRDCPLIARLGDMGLPMVSEYLRLNYLHTAERIYYSMKDSSGPALVNELLDDV